MRYILRLENEDTQKVAELTSNILNKLIKEQSNYSKSKCSIITL